MKILWPLVAVHVAIFLYLMAQPLYWSNDEILWHGFFWSMNAWDDFGLHTGLAQGDWIKVFHTFFIDGTFRTRQVSYLFEMLSFKFWQFFGLVLIKNYTLIILHVLNALLLVWAMYRLRKNMVVSVLSGLVFLNSGAALATLMYPFRNAKTLAVTFFLIAWIVSLGNQGLRTATLKRTMLFLTLILLGLLTDEISFFLTFLLVLLVILKEPGIWRSKRFVFGFFYVALAYLFFYSFFLYITTHIPAPSAETGRQQYFLRSLPAMLSNPQTYHDVALAFRSYFLKKNFGYWETKGVGLVAAVSAGIICVIALFSAFKAPLKKVAAAILLVFVLKVFLLPHNAGWHHGFMPEGTFFPSLLFFSYYYVYAEALLASLLVVILLEPFLNSTPKRLIVFGLFAVIAWSNVMHLQRGPADALNFMYADKPHRQKLIKDILDAEKLIRDTRYYPLYLSFPAGESEIVQARREDAAMPPFFYGRIIPVRYLRWMEQGKIVVSYKNKPQVLPSSKVFEHIKYFYDVKEARGLDWEELRATLTDAGRQEILLTKGVTQTRSQIAAVEPDSEIIFLVYGNAYFSLRVNNEVRKGIQTYGKSYEMFRFSVKELTNEPKALLSLNIQTLEEGAPGILLGPWIISSRYVRKF